jgi:hypothetical protein
LEPLFACKALQREHRVFVCFLYETVILSWLVSKADELDVQESTVVELLKVTRTDELDVPESVVIELSKVRLDTRLRLA